METRNASSLKVQNEHGEKLDVVVEGNPNAKTTVIFVHSLGTNKDDDKNLFKDIAASFSDKFRIVRFDMSACGMSEGKEEDSNLYKWSRDLNSIIEYVKSKYDGEICIIAHSFGTFVTAKLSPSNVQKVVFVAMANKDTSGSSIKERIRSRGGVVNEQGISTYPRTTGEVQKLGPAFWTELAKFKPITEVGTFASKTKLTIIEPKQDEVVKKENREGYEGLSDLSYIKLDGGHEFPNPEDRKVLIKQLTEILV
jgi:pimeloyl-ACP methyl ester carboxylesterase